MKNENGDSTNKVLAVHREYSTTPSIRWNWLKKIRIYESLLV